ncbi:ribosomal protein S18 acetylase RimI-like enzyme [Pedobacter sp. UYEF25]
MIDIRKATQQDILLISDLAKKTWPSAYLEIIGQAQIDYMLDKMYSEIELSNQMEDGHIFLIAEQNGQAVGFAGFSLITPNTHTYKLHKLYVLPEIQGFGLGKKLIDEIIRMISAEQGRSIILNVNKGNKAKLFYKKLGFAIIEDVKVDIGAGFFMDDFVMAKEI